MKRAWWLVIVGALVLAAGALGIYLTRERDAWSSDINGRTNALTSRTKLDRDVDDFVAGADGEQPPDAEMIFWEIQSWEAGGGRARLTLRADGRSEVRVWAPWHDPDKFVLNTVPGWTETTDADRAVFVLEAPYDVPETKRRFGEAFRLGIHLAKPVKATYVDGSGVAIGIQRSGALEEQVLPMFGHEHWETENYLRFKALERLLGGWGLDSGFWTAPKQAPAAAPNAGAGAPGGGG